MAARSNNKRDQRESSIFGGMVICISGTLSQPRADFTKLIQSNGGKVSSSVTSATTHLITTPNELESKTAKVEQALAKNLPIVGEKWIGSSVEQSELLPVDQFLLAAPAAEIQEFKIILHNHTTEEIGRAWEFALEFMEVGGTGHCMTNGPRIPANGSAEFTRDLGKGKVIPSSFRIKLMKKGLLVRDSVADNEGGVPVEHNQEYHFVLDTENPPLTKKEAREGYRLLREAVEGYGPINVPLAPRYRVPKTEAQLLHETKFWTHVVAGIGRKKASEDEATRKLLKTMISDMSCFSDGRSRFWDCYQQHPLRPVVGGKVALADLQKALESGKALVEVYYRAMDRFPGGNSDNFVIKTVFDPAKDEAIAYKWNDWDGTMATFDKPSTLEGLKAKFTKTIVPALQKLAAGCPDALKSTMESTIIDESGDSDEYETQWTSIEVLVYLLGDDDVPQLAMHVHQRALYPNMVEEDEEAEATPAEPHAQAVLDAVAEVLDMGEPEKFSEGENAAANIQSGTDIGFHCYLSPIFLNHHAKFEL